MDVKIQDENDEIIFLYQMKKGIYKTSSFGIQCAVKANINPNIIERAKVIRDSIENFKEIKPNPLCFDVEKETKTRQAIKLFLQWNGNGNPRELLMAIDKIMKF
ncbi:MutS domain III family protein [Histomonas meleagridis]|uniref:MutS domain III family protein n=1 Tax=Histomonas meleagridis TaxID=135588 RepID=UPI0035596310|nr:MutS domain III family protein [Histomonas meleagridis]KAH0801325.1 MutS domain III family protein [Histomonas meleagridis]